MITNKNPIQKLPQFSPFSVCRKSKSVSLLDILFLLYYFKETV